MLSVAPQAHKENLVTFPEAKLRGRILIVDDTFFMRVLLRTILTAEGHTIVGEATTGREAVSMFRLFRPDVVMMDITMPGQDGLAAMEEILRGSANAQVIVCTAMQFRRIATEAITRGARDFITKPFRPEAIKHAVENALLRQRTI
ncbi:MAG: response regulator [Bacteroidota bacterium]